MVVRLEHANVTVKNIDVMIAFLQSAFPDFTVRGEGESYGRRWVHVGNDDTYIALNQATAEPAEDWVPYAGKPGVNHLGYEVSDVAALQARMLAAGYRDSTIPNAHPHRRRAYFHDPEGNDWEFVEYLSSDPAARNDYELSETAGAA